MHHARARRELLETFTNAFVVTNSRRVVSCTHALFGVAAAIALGGCALGPTYVKPGAPKTATYTAAPANVTIRGAPHATGSVARAQRLVHGARVPARWWTGFGSARLDALVAAALARNPTIATARATLQQTQFEVRAAHGALYPHAGIDLGAERTRTSGAMTGGNFGPQLYDLYTGGVGVSYDLDVFDLNRSVVRAAQARSDVAAAQLDAARLTIAGNVVNTTIDLAALDAKVDATRKNVQDQQQMLALTQTRFRLGAIGKFAVFTQRSLLASTRATLAQILQRRDTARHLLATLIGEFPSASLTLAVPVLDRLRLPTDLPLSPPAALVRQRPDTRAAEAQLRGANAEVSAAIARMYPHFTLTANYGTASNVTHDFLDPASRLWDAAAALAAPLFEGGTLRAQRDAAQAAYRAVFATYQATVLNAFRNVADVLRALHHDATLLDARAQARDSARAALQLVTNQYQAGQVDFVEVLTNEMQLENARIADIDAQAQRYADTAALYVALGGGSRSATNSHPDGLTPAPSSTVASIDMAGRSQVRSAATKQAN